jgi:hypothetical protein
MAKSHCVFTNSKNCRKEELRTFVFMDIVALPFDINRTVIAVWKGWDHIKH